MNERERITQLEAMLIEEREQVYRFLFLLETYARGMDMMARTAFAETPARSNDEKNAMAVKQQSTDMLGWIGVKAEELRGLMGRETPSEGECADPMADAVLIGPLPDAVIH